jgi:hypothetical protein
MDIKEQAKDIIEEYFNKYKVFNEELLDFFLEEYYKENKNIDFETKKKLWAELVRIGKL